MNDYSVSSAAVVMVGIMAAILLGASNAHASASGCTQLGDWRTDYVCINVRGTRLWINTVRADYTAPIAWPCNTKLSITFFDLNNVQYEQHFSPLEGSCRGERAYTINPNRPYRAGRVCAALWINGVARPGACVSIHD